MSLAYLGAILVSALGVGAIDARWRLALFHDARRAVIAVLGTAAVLLLIDLAGIATGNFILGASAWMTGIEVLPHLPIEELAFIVFLAYVSLVAITGAARVLAARRERQRA
ncbi:lycopene cyclase domain-containing protein [Agrococcus carbonis]|uniref:Lycopene cyclase domain-containing protein n=1 Tax=Agrococcus carbonis TaxID=684552 RepID=A0A1H1P133_9MICO|nr:lycopene cyclase domain-containing protein [Agrococcus carbonis]SDS04914.1 lycopene cyclase domain-containing protein [Agrococcus carbonis]